MDASTTFGTSLISINPIVRDYIAGTGTETVEFQCQPDQFAMVWFTSWDLYTGPSSSLQVTGNIFNQNNQRYKFTVNASSGANTAGASNTSGVALAGVIFLAPGEQLRTSYTSSGNAGAYVKLEFSVMLFNRVTKV